MLRLLALLVTALVIAGCSAQGDSSSAGGGESGFVGGDGSIVVIDPVDRMPEPEVVGATLDGASLSLADYLGDVVVLNVWASWCAPCRAEAPELEEVWTSAKGDGVQFVGLNTRDSNVAAKRFKDSFGLTFPSIEDTDGRIQLLFSDSLPPQAIPSTLVIDRSGNVAARMLGRVSASTLRGVIDEVDRG